MENGHLLRILFVEDVPSDAELAQREIRKGDLEFSALRVDTEGEFLRALEEYRPHVIVSDYSMPDFDGMQALKLSLKQDATIPFIVLTGSMNEETAIACMKAGASDYVIKEQMSRLPYAVRDAIEQRRIRVANKEAERALLESEEKYRTLVDNANESILVLQDGLIRFVNRNATEVTGYSEQELLTKSFTDFIHPADREMVVQNYTRRIKGEPAPPRYVFRIVPKEGIAKWVETASTVSNWKGKPATLNFLTDITERKKSEQIVRDSEKRFKAIFDQAPIAMALLDIEGHPINSNTTLSSMVGYSTDELSTMTFRDFTYPEDLDKDVQQFAELVAGRISEYHMEKRFVHKSGRLIWASLFVTMLRDEHDVPQEIIGMAEDISERKVAEEQLRQSDEQFRLIAENATDLIAVLDLEGKRIYSSPSYKSILGDPQSLRGTDSFQEIHPEDREYIRRIFYETVRSGIGQRAEYRFLLRDGSVRHIESQGSVIRNEHGNACKVAVVSRDVTDRKKDESERQQLEDRIRQAQKMESIGTLAGGIAHDFNNILGIILGHMSLIRRPTYDEAMRAASAETITNAVQRGANLVRQILTFARKSEVELLPVNVNDSAREIWKMLKETFPKSIEFAVKLGNGLPFVIIDASQLHQVLLNLCVNARDAVVEGKKDSNKQSKITLRTDLVKGKQLRERFPEVSAEQYVSISVTDTGMGMDETTRKRIFEPFFTTKEKGKGTGLGLAVVYGVVKSAHGIVDVQSTSGNGSVFTIYLPVPKEASVLEAKPEKPQTEIRGGTETVFIVEDEETMLVVLKMSLQNKGYTILSAVDGREALQKFTEHKDRIDVVITDLGIPKLSGEDLVREMKKLKPEIKIIVASGFVDPDQRAELLTMGAKDVIMKPYEQSEVLEKIRSVLDER